MHGSSDELLAQNLEAVRTDPMSPDTHRNLAIIFMRREQYLDAINEYKTALKLLGSDDVELQAIIFEMYARAAKSAGNWEKYWANLEEYHQNVLKHPKKSWQARLSFGLHAVSAGRYEKAIELLEGVIAERSDTLACYHLGIAYKGTGDYKKALTCLIPLEREYFGAVDHARECFEQLGRPEEAKAILNRREKSLALRRRPEESTSERLPKDITEEIREVLNLLLPDERKILLASIGFDSSGFGVDSVDKLARKKRKSRREIDQKLEDLYALIGPHADYFRERIKVEDVGSE